jgi:hypothetical protein
MKKIIIFILLKIPIILVIFINLISCNVQRIQKSSEVDTVQTDSTKNRAIIVDNDTVRYLRNFMANKNIYSGKPLSRLLEDLKISIVSFSPFHSRIKSENSGISLFTEDALSAIKKGDRKDQPALTIVVFWQKNQPMDSVNSVYQKNKDNGHEIHSWTKYAKNYFDKIIVSGIDIPYYLK